MAEVWNGSLVRKESRLEWEQAPTREGREEARSDGNKMGMMKE